MSKAFFWREIYIWKYIHRWVRLAMNPCHAPRKVLQIRIEYIRLQEIAISCNLNQRTVESDLNEIWHSFYIPMTPQASYFNTLLIAKKGRGGKGRAHDTCKSVERGEHPYAKCECTRFFPFSHIFEPMSTLQVSCAHPFPPSFFIMSKVWKYEAWALIGM